MRKSFYSSICFQIHLLYQKATLDYTRSKCTQKLCLESLIKSKKMKKYIRKRLVSIKIEQIFYVFTSKWSISFIHYFIFCCKNFFAYQVTGQMPKRKFGGACLYFQTKAKSKLQRKIRAFLQNKH